MCKIKLSPLTNHRSTKKGRVKDGFDRTNSFQQVEQGFDKLFSYDRPLNENFQYYNTMKNRTIDVQISFQRKIFASENKQISEGKEKNSNRGLRR